MTIGQERDPAGTLGPRVERAMSDYIRYISTKDVAELLARVDDLVASGAWQITTLDRTNDGEFYAFLVRIGV